MFLSTTSHDELGHPVTLHLDAFGRAVRKTEPLDLSTTITTDYAYDRLGRLTGITDDAGNSWAYSFDSFGRTLTVDDPDLGLWTKTYDDAGQLISQTDALAQVTRFTYDLLGRMLTKTARDGTAQAELTSYSYDQAVAGFHNVGALTRAENPAGVLQYRYDQRGRELQRVYTLDGTGYTIASGFDIAGRLLWQDYPDGDAAGSALDPVTYDAAGRLAAIPGLVTAASYDASGNAETFTRANGVVSTYGTSDQRGWLDSLTTLSGATSIQSLSYTRDAAGQITSVASGQPDESWSYGYDALRRLLSATNTDTAAYSRTYTYDTIGNMLSNSGIAGSYSYPLPGSPRPHAVTAAGGWTYTYDSNGNMKTGAGRTFTYNGENRPTQIDDQTYSYGPDGERWKSVDSAPGGGTTLYLGGTIEIASGVMTKYLPGNAKRVGSPGDALVETFWLHHDHQGSIQAITDATGTEVQRFLYDPYGDRIATTTAHDESKGWIGERQDTTGLFYLHARYYDPVIGRFNSADPSDPLAPGVGLNRYAYAGNSPVMRIDPWGLKFVGNDEEGSGRIGGWKQVRAPSDERGRPGEIVIHGNDYSRLSRELGGDVVDGLVREELRNKTPSTIYAGSRFGLPAETAVFVSPEFGAAVVDLHGLEFPIQVAQIGNDPVLDQPILDQIQQGRFLPQLLRRGTARILPNGVMQFRSFRAFKNYIGRAGANYQWHHIVEQRSISVSRFGPYRIHSTQNLMRVRTDIHIQINAYYSSSTQAFTRGRTVRDWLRNKPFEFQHEFGLNIVRQMTRGPH